MKSREPIPYAFDPELAPLVPLLPQVDMADPGAAREALALFAAAGGSGVSVDRADLAISDHLVPHPGGPEVLVRVYRPDERSRPRAGLLYMHGGGFVIGTIETEEMNATTLARDLGIVVASVDYRLAPENPYPAGLDDCSAALEWLHRGAEEFGIDAGRIGVYGQSAGGGIAAALALRTRRHGGPPICFQFLGIPELDDRLDTPSMRAFVDTPLWNRPNAILSWAHYLGDLDGKVPDEAAPARASDLKGLPPAYISAMEFDPLRDEAIEYATRLLHAGVPTELHVFPGTFHGSSFISGAAITQRTHQEELAALRRGLRLDPRDTGQSR
ncbi:MAG: alpha/beta hydrolase [Acidimicrobiales bacterium]